MNLGAHRTDVVYAWPPLLELPPPKPTVVYLDLNHWIGLAQAATCHPQGSRHLQLLEVARARRSERSAVFVLSGQHYQEMSLIRDPRQRGHLASVMEELSGFATLLARPSVMRLEVEAAIDLATGTTTNSFEPVPLLHVGFAHAFGKVGGLRIGSRDGTPAAIIRQTWPGGPHAYDVLLADLQLRAEREMLAGPSNDDIDELLARGYVPRAAEVGQEQRALQEREQAARFEEFSKWRKGRIRDVVGARYVAIELFDMFSESLARRGLDLEEVWGGVDAARNFVDSMPSGDVHVSLQVAAHRNPQSTWSSNDYFDIDALSLAVPYCDIVLTEKHRCHALQSEGCSRRLGTIVVASPNELARLIREGEQRG